MQEKMSRFLFYMFEPMIDKPVRYVQENVSVSTSTNGEGFLSFSKLLFATDAMFKKPTHQ